MEISPSWKRYSNSLITNHSVFCESPGFLTAFTEVRHKDPVLTHLSPIYVLTSSVCKYVLIVSYNIRLSLRSGLFPFRFSDQNFDCILYFSMHLYAAPPSFVLDIFSLLLVILRRAQIIRLFIM
jgi:hypothetical protein